METIEGATAKLTARERKFFIEYIETGDVTGSYLHISPDSKKENAAKSGSRLLRKIKDKVSWEQLLSEAGLGADRLLYELEQRLKAKTTKHYQDKSLGEFEDNNTRMRATELLSDILGVKQKEISIDHTYHGHVVLIPAEARSIDDWMRSVSEVSKK